MIYHTTMLLFFIIPFLTAFLNLENYPEEINTIVHVDHVSPALRIKVNYN